MVREDLLQGFEVEQSREPADRDRECILAKVFILGGMNRPPGKWTNGTSCKGLTKVRGKLGRG